MCGRVGEGKTRQHVLRKEWRQRYPWLNMPKTGVSNACAGVRTHETRDVDFLNQQVATFCNHCNSQFMNGIELAAGGALDRLFTTPTLELRATDVEPLRRWAYMASLVRSLLDRASGRAVPADWFREFHRSGGAVPLRTSILIGRVDAPATVHFSRVFQLSDEGRAVPVQECVLMIGAVLLITTSWGPASEPASELIRFPSDAIADSSNGALARLDGAGPIRLRDFLRWQDLPPILPPSNMLMELGAAKADLDVVEAVQHIAETIGAANAAAKPFPWNIPRGTLR